MPESKYYTSSVMNPPGKLSFKREMGILARSWQLFGPTKNSQNPSGPTTQLHWDARSHLPARRRPPKGLTVDSASTHHARRTCEIIKKTGMQFVSEANIGHSQLYPSIQSIAVNHLPVWAPTHEIATKGFASPDLLQKSPPAERFENSSRLLRMF